MQVRLSQGPHIALGVAEISTPEQVRSAFLELTKQYHPARFGRMAPEIQKMSNEVFLGIKSAHEALLRGLGASLRPRAHGTHQSGGVPTVSQPITGSSSIRQGSSVPRSTSQIPPMQPPPPSRQPGTYPPVRAQTPRTGPTPVARMTPPMGIPVQRTPAAGSPVRQTPSQGVAVPRTHTPSRPPTPQPQRPGTPPMRAQTPPRTGEIDPGTIRNTSPPPTQPPPMQQRTAPVFDEKLAFNEALAHLQRGYWAAARSALHALASKVPQSRQYRGLLCYARGREALAAGKPDDAAMEFQRALQLDPELVQAKQALAEIKRR
jgi:hypothetical protein